MSKQQYHKEQGVLQLINCIQQLSDKNSNPVLEVLDKQPEFEYETKYPEELLNFCDANIKAYYHAHSGKHKNDSEHGHFHIFIKDPDQIENDWIHVVGLSMDSLGQARQWFTVNHWVVGGKWVDAIDIIKLLDQLDIQSDVTLIESWIIYMLYLYDDEIKELLINRDKVLKEQITPVAKSDILNDRSIYYLTEQSIDVQAKLTLSI